MVSLTHHPRQRNDRRTERPLNTGKANPESEFKLGQPDGAVLSSTTVLFLQRQIGNRAVRRLIAAQSEIARPQTGDRPKTPSFIQQKLPPAKATPVIATLSADADIPVQRLAWNENPVYVGKLAKIERLTGGKQGEVFRLQNAAGQQLVVKLQDQRPAGALLGAQVLQKVGALTPGLRQATWRDRLRIWLRLQQLKWKTPGLKDLIGTFLRGAKKFKYMLLMAFVSGKKSGERGFHLSWDAQFQKAILSPSFQKELGRILAADAFMGNADRIHQYKTDDQMVIYYNPGNLLFAENAKGEYHAYAIDNEFDPSNLKSYPYGASHTAPSIAAVRQQLFRPEVEAIFRDIIDQPEKKARLGKIKMLWNSSQYKEWEKQKKNFVATVLDSAEQAMKILFERGQGWKKQIQKARGDAEAFRIRKRYMRMVRSGMDIRQARPMAEDKAKYRQWVLVKEFGLSEEAARKIVAGGDRKYKQFMHARRGVK